METTILTEQKVLLFRRHLQEEERSPATIEKYLREVRQFSRWMAHAPVTKEAVLQWKEHLIRQGYQPSTINGKLTSLDQLFRVLGWKGLGVKHLRLQRKMFRDSVRELSRGEYTRLIRAAQESGQEKTALLMESICATGIRVSEVRYLTVEAAQQGKAEISLKGKIRTILLPGKLCRKLLKYAQKQKIPTGEIFLREDGQGLSRQQIWGRMKRLCQRAAVPPQKVFPHNLRHLFALAFYQSCRDVAKLADVLGHSSMETTRIYLLSAGAEHSRILERLRLVT